MTHSHALPPPGSRLPALTLGRHGRGRQHDDAAGAWSRATARPRFADLAYFEDVVFKRVVAHLIDAVIVAALMLPFGFFLVVSAIASLGLLTVPLALAFLALRFAYYVGFTGGAHSATPGMRLLGIELRTWTGGRPGHAQAALRALAYYASIALLTPLVVLAVAFNRERRALHDLATGTLVVNRLDAELAPA
jgi:uncharacterized RDD family membrane protein YckC